MQTKQLEVIHTRYYFALISEEKIFLCLIIPGPSTRQVGTTLIAQSLSHLNYPKLANPKVFTLSPLAFPQKASEGSGLMLFPHSYLLPPDHPGVFLIGPCVACCTSFSRTYECNKLGVPEPLLCLVSLSPVKKNSKVILALSF